MKDLYAVLKLNGSVFKILEEISSYSQEKLYIGAGAISQTIWNYKFKNESSFGISDIDIVFFNERDVTIDLELTVQNLLLKKMKNIPYPLDVKNQARVHLWYPQKFGYEISPSLSIENAVERWPTTATSIAVRLEKDELKIISPYGLDDLFSGIIRANKKQITEEIYTSKTDKWLKLWPELVIIPW